MNLPIHELAGIRSQINAIGININQITRHFHEAEGPTKKLALALKVAEQYRAVGKKEEELMALIEPMAKKWLSRENQATIRTGFKIEEFKILKVPADK